jgi:hypothetical protein
MLHWSWGEETLVAWVSLAEDLFWNRSSNRGGETGEGTGVAAAIEKQMRGGEALGAIEKKMRGGESSLR